MRIYTVVIDEIKATKASGLTEGSTITESFYEYSDANHYLSKAFNKVLDEIYIANDITDNCFLEILNEDFTSSELEFNPSERNNFNTTLMDDYFIRTADSLNWWSGEIQLNDVT